MIETTGQTARITRSIIAGQPRAVDTVAVVSIDGDTLTYTVDGVWLSTVTRSDIAGWELVEGDAPVTTHHHSDQSGHYAYTVALPLFTVSYDGDEQHARMTPWRVQEWDTITECPVDDTLTMLDGGAVIYRGIVYSLDWSVSAVIGLV